MRDFGVLSVLKACYVLWSTEYFWPHFCPKFPWKLWPPSHDPAALLWARSACWAAFTPLSPCCSLCLWQQQWEFVCLAVFANLAFSCLVSPFCWQLERSIQNIQWLCAWNAWFVLLLGHGLKENLHGVCVQSLSWSKGKLKEKEKVTEFPIPATTSRSSTLLSVRHHRAPSSNPPYL